MQRLTILAPLAMLVAIAQPVSQSWLPNLTEQPDAFIQRFYRQVVAAHDPGGVPSGADWKALKPFLSGELIKSIDLTRSCQEDWLRKNHGQMIKAPFAWGEAGLFSGANERTAPQAFQIEKTELKNDETSLVYVSLRGGGPPEKPWTWEIAVRVVQDNGHPAVDDVTYLKDEDGIDEYKLSQVLVMGCNGPHWVGSHDKL
ncbi:hypothetical protein [Terracidiphilus gabretensis]|jgi:hypothetical protein|uniref:hypothetical protein n=1 Tax=Terracidiphilus gabretensis TaxID=1577687 RepID=UPI00071BD846|nr:hypothetical protein [Terracidiphilus gabretensis]